MGTGRVTIAGIQFAGIAEEKERNIGVATRLIREAATQGAQIAMTPEVVLTGFVGGERERKMAEPIPGPSCVNILRRWPKSWASTFWWGCRSCATARL